jgi:hypothetical protein
MKKSRMKVEERIKALYMKTQIEAIQKNHFTMGRKAPPFVLQKTRHQFQPLRRMTLTRPANAGSNISSSPIR